MWRSYRLRWKRRELLWRSIRAFRRLSPLVDRTAGISNGDILLFAVIRNEASRLSEFLTHYRNLGVNHFLIVDNGSSDGSVEHLEAQPDVSLWRCRESYRDSRFGMDWIGALLIRHGHGHWCVTVDADELLIYPEWDRCKLPELTTRLRAEGMSGMGALMLELYPSGPLGQIEGAEDAPLTERLPWFDPGPYRTKIMHPMLNRIVQGGMRDRFFFANEPELSPTLNKLPLVYWHWRYSYANSTHSMFPPRLNNLYDGPGDQRISGVLLHGKFSADIIEKAREELIRRQHFINPDRLTGYYHSVISAPVLRFEGSERYQGWQQLLDLDLMGAGMKTSARAAVGADGVSGADPN